MSLLIKNGYIVTMNNWNQVIREGAILIQNDKIQEIGSSIELESKYREVQTVLDAKGRVVMPGFICAHMHFYSAFATGILLKEIPEGFVDILSKLWWRLDKALTKEDVYYSALLGSIEAIKNGTTTIIDHHASPNFISGSLDEIERATRKLGLRSCLSYEITNRNGQDEAARGLDENERFIKKCQNANDGMVGGLLGLHASFTLGDEEMEESRRVVNELDTGVHIHVAEGKYDSEDTKRRYNMSVVERLQKYELLNSKSILAHCIHLDDSDFGVIKDSGANVVHQPRSNMNNAVGSFKIKRFSDSGLDFGLGTDGMSADMKAELIVGNLIHKHVLQDNTAGTVEIYNALLNINPKIIENVMGVQTGILDIGKQADLLITDYYPKSPIRSENVLGHIIFGVTSKPIATTIINGQICMEEGVLDQVDEHAISNRCQDLASKAWDRF